MKGKLQDLLFTQYWIRRNMEQIPTRGILQKSQHSNCGKFYFLRWFSKTYSRKKNPKPASLFIAAKLVWTGRKKISQGNKLLVNTKEIWCTVPMTGVLSLLGNTISSQWSIELPPVSIIKLRMTGSHPTKCGQFPIFSSHKNYTPYSQEQTFNDPSNYKKPTDVDVARVGSRGFKRPNPKVQLFCWRYPVAAGVEENTVSRNLKILQSKKLPKLRA